jgi:integrase
MLTIIAARNAKPKNRLYRLFDERGLYLEVMPSGSKYWRLKYRFNGKEKRLALGVFPEISLAEAREKRDEARKLVAAGNDPAFTKKEEKRQRMLRSINTFEAVARAWQKDHDVRWSPHYSANVLKRLEVDIFPHIGNRPIAEISPLELLEVIKKIEKRGAHEVARRCLALCGKVYKYAIPNGVAERNPAADLHGALVPYKKSHFAALDIKELPEFLKALERNDARLYQQTRNAVRLLMLTFTRTSELINATWDEFNLDEAIWEIPAERMKMRKAHIVPLSKQAIEIFKEQKEMAGKWKWVFPNQVRPITPMSNNTVLFAIGRLGYKGRMTGHGFRALAMTAIKENLGYRHEVVDRQLAHAHRNSVDAAYDRAQFLSERKKMMQEWSDYIDALASGGKVVIGNFKQGRG